MNNRILIIERNKKCEEIIVKSKYLKAIRNNINLINSYQ